MSGDFRIEVFLMLASCGSFSTAARKLGITQPAVSQNIAELEAEIGRPLFLRSSSGSTLTPAGEAFKVYAEQISRLYQSVSTLYPQRLSGDSPLKIGAIPFIAEKLLPAVIERFLISDENALFEICSPDSASCDIRFNLGASSDTLFNKGSHISTLQAAVLRGTSPRNAVWLPYLKLLPKGVRADFASDSISLLREYSEKYGASLYIPELAFQQSESCTRLPFALDIFLEILSETTASRLFRDICVEVFPTI